MNLEVREFQISELHTYRRNPRRGDVDAIASSLRKRGQYRPIVVNLGTNASKRMEILAGNHTYLAAKQLGWKTIQATTVDVDDDQAAQIVLADNRLADLGGYDEADLAVVLQSVSDLEGTGYSEDDLKMRAVLCELDPRYGDVICRRFQEHTGIIPRCNGKEHDFTTE